MDKISQKWGCWETSFDADNKLGEVVVMDVSVPSVQYERVVASLKDAGLPEELARPMVPASALRRAVSKMRREHIVTDAYKELMGEKHAQLEAEGKALEELWASTVEKFLEEDAQAEAVEGSVAA